MGQPGGGPMSFLTIQALTSRPLAPERPGPQESGRFAISAPGGFLGVPQSRVGSMGRGLLGAPPGGSMHPGAYLRLLGEKGSGRSLCDPYPPTQHPAVPFCVCLPAS